VAASIDFLLKRLNDEEFLKTQVDLISHDLNALANDARVFIKENSQPLLVFVDLTQEIVGNDNFATGQFLAIRIVKNADFAWFEEVLIYLDILGKGFIKEQFSALFDPKSEIYSKDIRGMINAKSPEFKLFLKSLEKRFGSEIVRGILIIMEFLKRATVN
jgi:hypothetical protein